MRAAKPDGYDYGHSDLYKLELVPDGKHINGSYSAQSADGSCIGNSRWINRLVEAQASVPARA